MAAPPPPAVLPESPPGRQLRSMAGKTICRDLTVSHAARSTKATVLLFLGDPHWGCKIETLIFSCNKTHCPARPPSPLSRVGLAGTEQALPGINLEETWNVSCFLQAMLQCLHSSGFLGDLGSYDLKNARVDKQSLSKTNKHPITLFAQMQRHGNLYGGVWIPQSVCFVFNYTPNQMHKIPQNECSEKCHLFYF